MYHLVGFSFANLEVLYVTTYFSTFDSQANCRPLYFFEAICNVCRVMYIHPNHPTPAKIGQIFEENTSSFFLTFSSFVDTCLCFTTWFLSIKVVVVWSGEAGWLCSPGAWVPLERHVAVVQSWPCMNPTGWQCLTGHGTVKWWAQVNSSNNKLWELKKSPTLRL